MLFLKCYCESSYNQVPVAQLDRASASEAEGYRFEPRRGYLWRKDLRQRIDESHGYRIPVQNKAPGRRQPPGGSQTFRLAGYFSLKLEVCQMARTPKTVVLEGTPKLVRHDPGGAKEPWAGQEGGFGGVSQAHEQAATRHALCGRIVAWSRSSTSSSSGFKRARRRSDTYIWYQSRLQLFAQRYPNLRGQRIEAVPCAAVDRQLPAISPRVPSGTTPERLCGA